MESKLAEQVKNTIEYMSKYSDDLLIKHEIMVVLERKEAPTLKDKLLYGLLAKTFIIDSADFMVKRYELKKTIKGYSQTQKEEYYQLYVYETPSVINVHGGDESDGVLDAIAKTSKDYFMETINNLPDGDDSVYESIKATRDKKIAHRDFEVLRENSFQLSINEREVVSKELKEFSQWVHALELCHFCISEGEEHLKSLAEDYCKDN
ncbi:hypothetical protein NVP1063O_126 [Vibrio phage 1.063.O._10N.261.45.C7]|nr:hypothetical protein NVP1063O_126 [Vibrio phage 1.063.O._10N.261.45.C7]